MLASILNQRPTKIDLKKLINIKDTEEYEIITDLSEIKKMVTSHFQNAGIIEEDDKINDQSDTDMMTPPEIINCFEPKSDIDHT